MEVIKNGDPRSLDEAMENTLNPFRITENSMRKCSCGHSVGFHHLTGHCKGSLWGCKCTSVDVVHTFKCDTCSDTGEVAEMIHDTGDDMPGGGIFTQSGRTMPCPDCQ